MSKQTASSEEIDTITFVLEVLKQHEQEFNRLLDKLSMLTKQLRETEKMVKRIEKIDEKIETLRSEISNISKCKFKNNK